MTSLGFLFSRIEAANKAGEKRHEALHKRFDSLPDMVVMRREYELTIKGLERQNAHLASAIEELTKTVAHLSSQLDAIQGETASARVELLAHQKHYHGTHGI